MGTGVTDCGLGESCGPEAPGRVPKPILPRTWMHWNPRVQKPAGDAASREQLAGLKGTRVTSWGAVSARRGSGDNETRVTVSILTPANPLYAVCWAAS